jgi:hypothetical protein
MVSSAMALKGIAVKETAAPNVAITEVKKRRPERAGRGCRRIVVACVKSEVQNEFYIAGILPDICS